ncbi:argininosuccinate synthase [Pseudothermotoga sp. U03pept]|uniref:argininosuccinate synthase n=1 Tax=Pseudothermotoga sp. U03pept TaxID=3447012 RepID=UPI003F0D8BAF
MEKEKVILAYSGGLDTSVILKWLCERNFEVIAYVANVGQQEDFQQIEEKALKTGAVKVYVEDLRREFVTQFIFVALMGNAVYEGRYLLGTSLARPLIAKRQVEIALMEEAQYLAHGATGKGNDQVRFELTYAALAPQLKVISPWKDPEFLSHFKGRTDLINYAKKKGIPVKASAEKPYSEDENLMHISHEAGMLEDPSMKADESIFNRTVSPKEAPDQETVLQIHFKDGVPIKILNLNDSTEKEDPLEIFEYLNKVGAQNGVGRVDMVENRFIGIKSRGVYETPGATILWIAHRDLEGIAMDKEVMHLRDMLAPKFSELIYNGFWFSPEMDFLLSAFKKSQEGIDGVVTVSIYKGNVMPISRYSPTSLYNQALSSMDVEGGFDSTDSKGFINIHAIRLKAHNVVLREKDPYAWRKGIVNV